MRANGWRLERTDAPDFAEPIEAWRVWRVVNGKHGYRLGSVVKETVWRPGEAIVADCLRSRVSAWLQRRLRRDHAAPEKRCECGVYAAWLPYVEPYLTDEPVSWAGGAARVLGKVSLWGVVIECERGFRASAAYPSELYVPADASLEGDHRSEDIAMGLAVYGTPVELLSARREEAVGVLQRRELASLATNDL